MPITLTYIGKTSVPVEIEGVTPASLRGLSESAILGREIFHGNQKACLGDFFRSAGSSDDDHLILEGELSGVHWIGAKLEGGTITIRGSAGRHLGSEMRSGEIHVHGDAGDWLGGEMHGGLIHVRGRAGHQVGAAYRGSRRGMTKGTILVEGDAGNEIGHTMRRGLIAIGGQAGDLVGFNMLAGTILIFGACGIRVGAGMKRGTISLLGGAPPMLTSFRRACRLQPSFFPLLSRQLARQNFSAGRRLADAQVDLYHGDLIEGGRGEVLIGCA